jgi:hypothetical protein
MATIRREMDHFGVTVIVHVEFEKIAYRQTGRWPKTSVFGHSNQWAKNSFKSMAAVPLWRRVFGPCHKWPISRRIVALYHIRRIARELNVPLTVRRVPGGVIFWRSREEDLRQAQEVASRLQSAQRGRQLAWEDASAGRNDIYTSVYIQVYMLTLSPEQPKPASR